MKTKPENIPQQPALDNASEGKEEHERTPAHPESFFCSRSSYGEPVKYSPRVMAN